MAYTFEELKHKTLAELREIAKGSDHEAVQGYTQMNKEHLRRSACRRRWVFSTSITRWSALTRLRSKRAFAS